MKFHGRRSFGFAWIILVGGPMIARGQCSEALKIVADDGERGTQFGYSIAVEGDVAVVGAPHVEVNGMGQAGAAYVFRRENGLWRQTATLHASDVAPFDAFGAAVRMEGDVIVVNASEQISSGTNSSLHVFRYDRDADQWNHEQQLGFGGYFGRSVALNDGWLIVGQRSRENVFIYRYSKQNEFWELTQSIPEASDNFGWSLAAHGDRFIVCSVSSSFGGTAFFYRLNADQQWVKEGEFTPPGEFDGNWFGYACDIQGDVAVVTAPGDGGQRSGPAYVFRDVGVDQPDWRLEQRLDPPSEYGHFGQSAALLDNHLVIGANWQEGFNQGSGMVFVYTHDGREWMENARLARPEVGSNGHFGRSAVLTQDAVYVGQPGTGGVGALFAFDRSSCLCTFREKLKRPTCKARNDKVLINAKVVGGRPASGFRMELSTGDTAEGFLDERGIGKAKFIAPEVPPEGTLRVHWSCGSGQRTDRRRLECS